MRIFIAVEANKEVNEYLKTVQSKIKIAGIKMTKEFHLTLRFVGEISDKKVDMLKKALSEMKYEKFTAKLDGIGYFPETGKIRVAWVGLRPEDQIMKLHQIVDETVEKIGHEKNKQFKSHITIARVKFIKNKREFKDKVNNVKIDSLDFPIDNIKLIKSTPTDEGHIHEVIGEY